MTPDSRDPSLPLEQRIKDEARRLGFILAGVTSPDPPAHFPVFEEWLRQERHGTMAYLATQRSRERRAAPRAILPNCRSIVVLATRYQDPGGRSDASNPESPRPPAGSIASYAWGQDYHEVLPGRLNALVQFIERQVGRAVEHSCYTDTGPILERDLAQRAGLGWIGRNSCLIHPRHGSYVFLSEILLDIALNPDEPFRTDHCGKCRRCIDACPTSCILPSRTIDATRCISYLTIEHRGDIPVELRPALGGWVFGCDICQMVCPWNRGQEADVDVAFGPAPAFRQFSLVDHLRISPKDFNEHFSDSAIRRAKYAGYLRNLTIAAGNSAGPEALPALQDLVDQDDQAVAEHAAWAIRQINERQGAT